MDNSKEIGFGESLRFWARLGLVSFGGPAGQIAIMQRELVERRKWIAHDDFLHALNFCMLLPGPEAQQLATYLGWRLHGIRGGIAAGALFVLPSVVILFALSYVYAVYRSLPLVDSVLDGFKAVVVAVVIEAVIRIARRSFVSAIHAAIAAAAFLAMFLFGVPFPLIVAGAALAGFFLLRRFVSVPPAGRDLSREPRAARIPLLVFAFVALWAAPLAASLAIYGPQNLATQSYLFFSKAAFVTFGGAYAVLAYVNQAVVEAGWISAAQAVDGLALAETTPGPLIMVLQFIGFMAGWNNPGESNPLGFAVVCALLATYATFLPSFFFIFAGAPFIERLRHNRALAATLAGVTAAVVGVILNLGTVFGSAVILPGARPDPFAAALALAALGLLQLAKLNVVWVIVIGGICGLVKFVLLG